MSPSASHADWPSSLRIKICGITQVDQGYAIVGLGAHALGFICVPQSPRFIAAEQIYAITQQLPAQSVDGFPLARIGVFANATKAQIQETIEVGQLTGIQLHGSESLAFCQQLRQAFPQVELIKAFRVKDASTLTQVLPYQNTIDTLLLDAYTPQALGGTGESWDWSLVSEFSPQCPWFLAGGLTPDNVTQALSQTRPSGIDLSSGLENAPGDKDLMKVKRLFQQLSN